MKTILVATDHSEVAANAVNYAAHLAKDIAANLVLFNVFKLSVHANNSLVSATSMQNLKEKSENQLNELKAKIEGAFQIEVSWELGKDDTIDSLQAFMNEKGADLVVMGIENNLTDYKLFGNTTTDAIKLMEFPLLVVPDNAVYVPIKTVSFACEPSILDPDNSLSQLKDFVKLTGSKLVVMHIMAAESEEKRKILERKIGRILSTVNHSYRYVISQRVGDGIEMGLAEYPAELLVMIPHRLGFFEAFFKGSHTSYMAVRTKLPLLVIPN